MDASDPWTCYVAGSGRDAGLWSLSLDARTGELSDPVPRGCPGGASFVCVGPGGSVYAVRDDADAAGLTGRLYAYRARPDGKLVQISERRTEGTTPCYVSVAPDGGLLYVAGFRGAGGRPSAGSVAVFERDASGLPSPPAQVVHHSGSSVHPERQTNPHPHCIVPHPNGELVLVCDLGIDAVVLYLREQMQERFLREVDRVAAEPGSGPRHAGFSPDGRFAFVVHEMSNKVDSYRVHGEGRLERVDRTSALPTDLPQGESAAADLHVHPSGRFLYTSNRGHDSISVLRVGQQGHLQLLRCVPAGGGNPRGFALTPDGRFLVAGLAAEDRVAVFAIDPDTGDLEPTGHRAEVPGPVCIDTG
jgi:6-phosphogluconolactonase